MNEATKKDVVDEQAGDAETVEAEAYVPRFKQRYRDVVIDVLRSRGRRPADVHVRLPVGDRHGPRQ